MNVPGQLRRTRGRKAASGSRNAAGTSVVAVDGASRSRQAACDLYLECTRQVLGGGITVHALIMPGLDGRTLPMNADEDVDLREAVENLTGNHVKRGDLVVLLGPDLLDDVSIIGPQMMMVAIADIAYHVDSLYPASDRSTGWLGKHIGTAATAAVMAAAHESLRALRPEGVAMEAVKSIAAENIRKGISVRTSSRTPASASSDRRLADLQVRPAMEAIDIVCEQAMETHGGYMNLPAAPQEIASAAKMLLLDCVDRMIKTPRPII